MEKTLSIPENAELISLKEMCDEISISTATGKNWIKLDKIKPESMENGIPLFSKEYVQEVKKDMKSGVNTALKSRRNKKYLSGSRFYNSYVSEESINVSKIQDLWDKIAGINLKLTNEQIRILVAECAVQLIVQREKNDFLARRPYLSDYLAKELSLGRYQELIDDLVGDYKYAAEFIIQYPELFENRYVYEEREDILGLLYISSKNIGNRKATGSYYTPTKVVNRMIQKLFESQMDLTNKTVLDPCCGTGNFLLQLPEMFSEEQLYGNDIDPISVKITRLNIALKYREQNTKLLYQNITESNYLTTEKEEKFDFILGNPPWGYAFDVEEKEYLRKSFICATGQNIESYDVFIERALEQLKIGGSLSFVLPEAILNVKTHTAIRKVIIAHNSIQYVEFLGNVFDKVQCPSIILQLLHNGQEMRCVGMEVNDGERCYQVNEERKIETECFRFTTTDTEYRVIRKIMNIPNKATLEGNATFALGIVTGNNQEYIVSTFSEKNESILKGSDINKFKTKAPNQYIAYLPEKFQQVAPTEYYRATEKLLYRFICSQLVFAYDNKQTLSLNSCNIVIPDIKGLEIKYILAILNSRVAQFVFKKQFHSVKVLRSHIEQIPIPVIDSGCQAEVIDIVDQLLADASNDKLYEVYNQLDNTIAQLYKLTEEEYAVILDSLEGENIFLF